jgi:arylsulfatase A-like enzyme
MDNTQQQPNIIFILIDDLGWRDLTCYGSTYYETPNLDRLASEGMTFSDAYAACPVCSPTRASILTGKYPATVGVTDWIDWGNWVHPARGRLVDAPYIDHLPLDETSLAAALKTVGYHTWHVGKWHLGGEPYLPGDHGFDLNIGGCHWGAPLNGYFSPYDIPGFENGPEGEYLTDRLTDEAVKLIENVNGAPFFLNLWYYAVHTPIQAKPELITRFEEKAREMGLDDIDPFDIGDPFPTEHKKELRITRRLVQSDPVYAAMVYTLDENIGRLMDALDRTGQADKTIVIFTSDNGGLATAEGSPTCNAPLSEGKGWMYEGGTREPLIFRWPGVIKPGTSCQVPVTSPDFYPTFLEMVGAPHNPEQHTDGTSLMPLLKGATSLNREAIFWHYPHYGNQGGTPGSSLRAGDYKLIHFFEDDHLELYNLRVDIEEEHNLAHLNPQLTAELARMLADWRRSVEAKIPQPNPEWDNNGNHTDKLPT